MWLPHLADPAWVRDLVARRAEDLALAAEVHDVRLVDVRLTHPHRPESPRCRGWATWSVELRGTTPVQLYLKGFADRAAAEAAWRHQPSRSDTGFSYLPADDLLVWRFPHDPRLESLPALLAPARSPEVLPARALEVLDARPDELRVTVVRYQPETSATLRFSVDERGGPAVFAKHLADGSIGQLGERQELLFALAGREPALRVAEPLAADRSRRVLWTRAVAGTPLTQGCATDALPAAAASAGALLAALHRSGVEPDAAVTVDGLVRETHKKAAKLALAHPDVAPVVTALVASSSARRDDVVRERSCSLHGDFHLDQLVSSPAGPVLVDLDSMVRGAPEVDLAEFLVDLALRRLPGTAADAVARELVASYTAAGGGAMDPALLQVCADAEFVNRCYRHLRRHTSGWEQQLEAELARHADVVRLLQDGTSLRAV